MVTDRDGYIVVVCRDGACYRRQDVAARWQEIEPVPGTPRAATWTG